MKLTLTRCCHFSGVYLMKKVFFVCSDRRGNISPALSFVLPAPPPPPEQQVCDQKASAAILKWAHYLGGGAFESKSKNPLKMVCRVMKDVGWLGSTCAPLMRSTCTGQTLSHLKSFWLIVRDSPNLLDESHPFWRAKHDCEWKTCVHRHTPHTVY